MDVSQRKINKENNPYIWIYIFAINMNQASLEGIVIHTCIPLHLVYSAMKYHETHIRKIQAFYELYARQMTSLKLFYSTVITKNKPKLNQCWPQKVRDNINMTMVQGSYGFLDKKNIRKAVTSRKIERKLRLSALISITLLVRFHGFRLRLRNFSRTKL